ncbi:hypothetical protein SAMN05421780_11911 [Flexibacter flexilis DSM 6793]|uniref:Phage protein, HK97 gp10 family n=1 Tax=Flexibacter flexilis DSM 6793 TaxID=927664 RepID=A0A1I1NYY7_9BACT|nr:hypothetical protein [Flexibacter flexilis]SFD00708.1 hypothetical protein SAMN05421780_11911 [Flexibacter flexilis DSM 6793]
MSGTTNFFAVYALVQDWANRTARVLREQIKQKKVKHTDELLHSIAVEVAQKEAGVIEASFSFKLYGRFVDMGAGRRPVIESAQTNREVWQAKSKGRKPKKWYSRPYYGRVHVLNAVVSSKVAEQAVNTVKSGLGN